MSHEHPHQAMTASLSYPSPLDLGPQGPVRCTGCWTWLTVTDFARDQSKASGRKSRCRACDNARSRRYYAENREAVIARVSAAQAAVKDQSNKGGRDE